MRIPFTALALSLAACHQAAPAPTTPAAAGSSPVTTMDIRPPLLAQQSGTTRRLQAVSAVNDTVAWVSGAGGAWAVTVNGGQVWRAGVVPGADSLEFRDIHAADGRTAWLLAAGPGDRSRIYRTSDGGANWALQWTNRDPDAFFDCFAFWDRNSAIAFSDNVRGVFPVLRTDDGATWRLISDPASPSASPLPPASEGEGAFAASGTCVATHGRDAAWIATGAGKSSRILYTPDRGKSWTSSPTPIVQGTATSGHAGIAFRDDGLHGLAVGGDVGAPDGMSDNVVLTEDGGRSWTVGGRPMFAGAIYGAAIAPGAGPAAMTVAVGPKGASWSQDGGRSWMALDTLNYWSVGFASPSAGWMVGPEGRITRIGVSLVH